MCTAYGSTEHLLCSASVTGYYGDADLLCNKALVHDAGIKVGPYISNLVSIDICICTDFGFFLGGGH